VIAICRRAVASTTRPPVALPSARKRMPPWRAETCSMAAASSVTATRSGSTRQAASPVR
jgi:hypothetical protein